MSNHIVFLGFRANAVAKKTILLAARATMLFFVFSMTVLRAQEPAETPKEAAAAITSGIANIEKIANELDDTNDFPSLGQRKTKLDAQADALALEAKALKDKYDDLLARSKKELTGKNDKAKRAAFKKEMQGLDAAKTDFKTRVAEYQTQAEQWLTDVTAANDRRKALSADAGRLWSDMQPSIRAYKACMDRFPRDSSDELKFDCGNVPFDNVRSGIKALMELKLTNGEPDGKSNH